MRKLASAVAKREGKKSQASIGNIRESLKSTADVLMEEFVLLGKIGPLNADWDKMLQKAMAKAIKKQKNSVKA